MRTKKIFCKVFLEGIQVEFNSIQINEDAVQPPRAIISFPADSAALTLLPKTVIHVFYRDDDGDDVLIFQGELAGSGITFSSDKRSINLTFTAISQNWNTNVILPMDLKVRTMAATALYVQVVQQGDRGKVSTIKFTDIEGLGKLDGILSLLSPPMGTPATLNEILKKLIDIFGENFEGAYWKYVAQAFKFNDMVIIDANPAIKQIEKLLMTVAVMEHIKNIAKGVPAGTSISELLTTILDSCGFCYSEIAAPTYLGGQSRAHILVKPKTHFFPPIRHNLVIDDEVVQLNFTRNFDEEPTRLVGQTVPFFLPSTDMNTTIIGVVVPNNVKLAKAVAGELPTTFEVENNDVDSAQYNSLKMFGLSKEEQCRGVVLAEYQDTSLIENSYFIALSKDADERRDPNKLTDEDREKLNDRFDELVAKEGGELSEVETYHMNIATTMYYDRRHQARTVQINSPYSPYRMVDFPGVIVSKYFPTNVAGIVGNLQNINSIISADGEASQTLLFTHCRFVDANASGTSTFLGFLDDDMLQPVPWYKDYTLQNNIDDFYKQFTGSTSSTIIKTTGKAADAVYRAILDIKKEISIPENQYNMAAYMLRKTRRPLVKQSIITSIFNSTRSLGPDGVWALPVAPYVNERKQRVLSIFKRAKPEGN